jgi:undecaprenyl-diphosphatase
MNIDHTYSKFLFRSARESSVLRPFAIFCATILPFVMATALVMTYAGADPSATVMNRLGGSILPVGIPLLVVWLVTILIQHVVKRERPFDDGQGKALITMVWEGPSFPSVHASLAFALAILSTLYALPMFGPWMWIGAVLVAWGRVAVGVHYVSDVVIGAVLGVVVGWASTMGLVFTLVSLGWMD